MVDGEKFYVALSQGKMDEVKILTQDALDKGEAAETILKDGLIQAMDRVGVRFKNGEIYIPEVLIAARAMHAGMAILKPILSQSTGIIAGKVIIGTVKGDLHDIGKNLVIIESNISNATGRHTADTLIDGHFAMVQDCITFAEINMMLEGGGFEVVDLGIDLPANKFIEAIKQHQPQVVGMSALLTTTMREMKTTIQAMEGAGLRRQVKTVVGGAPLTEKFAKEIGADGYAPDAASAVDVVKSLLQNKI